MSFIGWIVLGLIAGFIASKIVNREGSGFLRNIALGVVGALVGGLIFDFIGGVGITGFNLWSLLVATGGAVVVLLIFNALPRRTAL